MISDSKGSRINCVVGGYHIRVNGTDAGLEFQAFNETDGNLFRKELRSETLTEDMIGSFGDCTVLFSLLEDAAQANTLQFSTTGELRFTFGVKLGKCDCQK